MGWRGAQEGLRFDASASERDVAQGIRQRRPVYEESVVKADMDNAEQNNRQVRSELTELDRQIAGMRAQKQDWLRSKDVVQQLVRLDSLRAARAAIKGETRKALGDIAQFGVYLVVLDKVDPYASKEQLRGQARAVLAPKAIQDLNGIFVESTTEVRNNMMWNDIVRTEVAGRLEIEEDPVAQPFKKSGRFVYVARVKVRPLAQRASLEGSTGGGEALLVKAIASGPELLGLLAHEGIEMPASAEKLDSYYFSEVVSRNQLARQNRDGALADGERRLKALDEQLRRIEDEVASLKVKLQLQDVGDFELEGLIGAYIDSLDGAIARAAERKLSVKERELLVRSPFAVTSESEPPEDIARAVLGALRQQQESFGKVENFFEQAVVENLMLSGLSQQQGRDVFRKPAQFWIYPILTNDDSYRVSVITRFRMVADDGSFVETKSEPEPEPSPEPAVAETRTVSEPDAPPEV